MDYRFVNMPSLVHTQLQENNTLNVSHSLRSATLHSEQIKIIRGFDILKKKDVSCICGVTAVV